MIVSKRDLIHSEPTMTTPSPFMKKRLFCPGPTPVPIEAGLAGLDSSVYHRTDEFYRFFLSCRELLAPLMGTHQLPLLLTASGTGAMESAVVNLTNSGDEVIVLSGGKFGERWRGLCEQYQCKTQVISVPWGESPTATQIEQALNSVKQPRAFFMQANETSTGVFYPVQDIIKQVRHARPDCLIIVDAISGVCAHELKMDAWGIDCLVSASQKGFGVPPGLAFIALSKRAEQMLTDRPKFYFDLRRELKGQTNGRTAWTPATTLLQSLKSVLDELNEQGIEAVINHHQRLANATRAAAEAMALKLFPKTHPSNALTTVSVPDGIDGKKLVAHLRQQYGATFAGGQDHLAGKIVRLAHLGFVDPFDVLAGVAALECGLHDLGHKAEKGAGVRAFVRTL